MKKIFIRTDDDELKISQPQRPLILNGHPEFDRKKAWELANLIRIAAKDFQLFEDWFEQDKEQQTASNLDWMQEANRDLGKAGNKQGWLYVKDAIASRVIDEYHLNEKEINFPDLAGSNEYDLKYKILKTYEYVAFYPMKFQVDIDRFGFIAQREEAGQNNIYIVFRGTRERGEWFNNTQFKQVNFLETEQNPDGIAGCGKISLGFNKMYADFRPGLFQDRPTINSISNLINQKAIDFFEEVSNFSLQEQTIYRAIESLCQGEELKNPQTKVYIAGHSLGGALATIAALHIALKTNLQNPIHLYTFASPRVGDNVFADKFNQFVTAQKIQAFRIANSEDLVTKIPLPVWFKLGLENEPLIEMTRSAINTTTGGVFAADYQHVGTPMYFTHQALRENQPTATVGDNHNMTRTYCGALREQP